MTKNLGAAAVAALLSLSALSASADVWDLQTDNDDVYQTDNELTHGSIQQHDLGARPGPVADQDWYLIPQRAYASFEVIIDGVSGDLGNNSIRLSRYDQGGNTVQQESGPATGVDGYSRALRWSNATGSFVRELIRVGNGACLTACGADDVYTIRSRDTTIGISRWNASGGQTTVLQTQNVSERTVFANFFYWSASGTLLQHGTLSLPPRQLNVWNVSNFGALAGQSGHITIAHDGGYGALNVKAVALEPSTGFTFDTPGTYLPY